MIHHKAMFSELLACAMRKINARQVFAASYGLNTWGPNLG